MDGVRFLMGNFSTWNTFIFKRTFFVNVELHKDIRLHLLLIVSFLECTNLWCPMTFRKARTGSHPEPFTRCLISPFCTSFIQAGAALSSQKREKQDN